MSIFQNFLTRYLPTVKASDEELVDPQKQLREECGALPKCVNLQEKLNTCNDRVNSKKKTAETCLEELLDYLHCVDHCVAKTLFTKLK
ncbi:cytochrome b-c1 complex subunit 6, mitochondrial [Athalia rosae]|uniref:cytochrome b-c1 complex subunit 6, mitochondrial n=1 Tax=Athalia rosae TaxID=37344 RepID=UPI000626AE7A|nr:cytochrome b-c1 complex subunit 6, mitochondrial [Athalia rosae]XP_012266866.1 cytochrome b-c1 complex subunit 6, mitochondrial [Athalia rosae]